MSVRRFNTLIVGLSPHALYRLSQHEERRRVVVKGSDVDAYFRSIGTSA